MANYRYMMSAEDIVKELNCSKSHAYKIVKELNRELAGQGYITMAGRIVEEPKPEPVQEEIQPEPEKGGMGIGALFTIILLGAGCVGGYYYFKIWKPKREEEEAESENLEFYDGGAYVNEDQENGQGEEEGGE